MEEAAAAEVETARVAMAIGSAPIQTVETQISHGEISATDAMNQNLKALVVTEEMTEETVTAAETGVQVEVSEEVIGEVEVLVAVEVAIEEDVVLEAVAAGKQLI